MIHPKLDALAEGLIGFSTHIQVGDNVLLDLADVPREIGVALLRAVRKRGGVPFLHWQDQALMREFIITGDENQFVQQAQWELDRMQTMHAYVAIRGAHNIFEQSDLSPETLQSWLKATKPVLEYRVNNTKWVILRWPTPSMAQLAGMSTEAFEDFFFRVCTLDYSRMIPGMAALKERMEATDQVHILSEGTDLRFSIKGIPAIPCGGKHNIPDGEVFTAPIKDSVEGVIQYNTPTVYQGTAFDHVRFVFRKGKIVEATASNTRRLNEILDADEGARYIGEFALGFNPHIQHAIRDILFDEKIAGSFHFTPGQAYETADNGNRSQVHWDLVCIQRPEYGGGQIYFDGELIRQDGRFIAGGLEGLNPEALLS